MKTVNKVLIAILILCFVILCGFYSIIIRGQKDISEAEQRTLQHVPVFSFDKFIKGSYQKELEDSIADQIAFSEEIKFTVKILYNKLTSTFSDIVISFSKNENNTNDVTVAEATNKAEDIISTKEQIVSPVTSSTDTEIVSSQTETKTNEIASTTDVENKNESQTKVEAPKPKRAPIVEIETEASKNSPYKYRRFAPGVYKLDDSDYIVWKSCPPELCSIEYYNLARIKALTYPKYMYFINSSSSTDFTDMNKYDYFGYIKKMLSLDYYAQLSFKDFEEYKQYFYQTDHHWNYKGSYKGYCEIMKMMEGEDVVLHEPVAEKTYNVIYNGSLARSVSLDCSSEKFTVYEFDLPKSRVFINDEEKALYGQRNEYISIDQCPNGKFTNHYGVYYGGDYAKVVYQFDNPDAESILILATSFSNAINELIASHYKETHILDFRHYYKLYGHVIYPQQYMDEHHLTKMLMLGDIGSFFKREE